MNKKSENNINTERILKSKYIEKDKQKTVCLLNDNKDNKDRNKIMLIDLCQEEKIKVGELIKRLEIRRI